MINQKIKWAAIPHVPLLAMARAQLPVACMSIAILLSISGSFYFSSYDAFVIITCYIIVAITFWFLAAQNLYLMDDSGIYIFPIWTWRGVARPMVGKKIPFSHIKDFEVIPVKACKGSIIVFHGAKLECSAAYCGDRISLGGNKIGSGISLGSDKIYVSHEFSDDVDRLCEWVDDLIIMANKSSYSLLRLFFTRILFAEDLIFCRDAVLKLVLAGLVEHGVRSRQMRRRRQSPPLTRA